MPKCDYGCGQEAVHQFKNGKWCCSKYTSNCPMTKQRTEQTCIEKYGVPHPQQSKEVQERTKQTCKERYGGIGFKSNKLREKSQNTTLERYGVKIPLQSKEIQEKCKNTCIKKYGVPHPQQSKEVQERTKQTCIEKYGIDNVSKVPEIIRKITETSIEKYGVKNPYQYKEFQEKFKNTCIKKYGVPHPLKTIKVQEKIKKTMMKKYGVSNASHSPIFNKIKRLKAIERIESSLENGYQIMPNFNPAACALIDEYGKKHGYNFQHAMNGGEYKIDELGYWFDGYDPERNTVIEVDEAHHFDVEGNLLERDIRRQVEIEEFLGCDFIRLRI